MADLSVTADLEAQQLYNELKQLESRVAEYASKTVQQGEKAATGLTQPFKGIGGKLQGFLGEVSNIAGPLAGIFTVAGIEHAITGAVEYGTKVEDLSRRFGVASETIQKFGNAAELNGSSLDAVAKGFGFLEKNIAKAIGGGAGSEAARASFEALGVTLDDLKSKRPDDIALEIGKGSLKADDFAKIFGRSALELRTTLAGLADGTIEFGNAISGLDTERLKEADDLFKKIGQEAKIATATVLGELGPAIGKLQTFFAKPFEAVTRLGDNTPTGSAAAPEDSALAAQIHASREAAAGTSLPPELAPEGEIKEKKPRRDFGDPDEIPEVESKKEAREAEKEELDVIGADRESKLEDAKEQKEARDSAEKEKQDAEKKALRDEADRVRDQGRVPQRQLDEERRALNPTGLSLHDIASANIIGSQATGQAQEAEREEKIAKQRQLAGDLPGAQAHQNRAEELKKALGLDNQIDRDALKKVQEESRDYLKQIKENTEAIGANK